MDFRALFKKAVEAGASDIHLHGGRKPVLRVHGALVRIGTAPVVLIAFIAIGLSMRSTLGPVEFELNRFVIRIGYLVMVATLLGYLGLHERRLREEIEHLARWPPAVGVDRSQLTERVLAHACAVVGAGTALVVWEQIDPCVKRSLQSAGRPIVGEEMSTGVAPTLRSNHPWPAPPVDGLDDIERREEASLGADVRGRNPGQRDELAVLVCADIEHTPSGATDADVLRNLHRGSAARV